MKAPSSMGKAHFEQFSFDQLHFRVICSWLNDDCLVFAFDSDVVANVDGINVFERNHRFSKNVTFDHLFVCDNDADARA